MKYSGITKDGIGFWNLYKTRISVVKTAHSKDLVGLKAFDYHNRIVVQYVYKGNKQYRYENYQTFIFKGKRIQIIKKLACGNRNITHTSRFFKVPIAKPPLTLGKKKIRVCIEKRLLTIIKKKMKQVGGYQIPALFSDEKDSFYDLIRYINYGKFSDFESKADAYFINKRFSSLKEFCYFYNNNHRKAIAGDMNDLTVPVRKRISLIAQVIGRGESPHRAYYLIKDPYVLGEFLNKSFMHNL